MKRKNNLSLKIKMKLAYQICNLFLLLFFSTPSHDGAVLVPLTFFYDIVFVFYAYGRLFRVSLTGQSSQGMQRSCCASVAFSSIFQLAGTRDVMAFLSLFMRRQLPPAASHFARIVKLVRPPCAGAPLRKLHGASRLRVGEKGPWGKSRGPEQQYQFTDLDKADALVGLVPEELHCIFKSPSQEFGGF